MNRIWLITGCSTGFGKLLAQKALDQGDGVAATARNADQLHDVNAPDPQRLLRLTLDVTRGEQIRAAVAQALDHFGRIDVLVNNAGYGYFSTQEDGDLDEIRRMFETNVFGLIRLTQAVLPHMRENRRGTIVNLSSVAGRVAFPRSGFYNAAKWSVEAMSESLHYEVHPFGIRVIVVEPGAYATDFGPRSAVRSPRLNDPASPYAAAAARWTAVASEILASRQDPLEVVHGILAAVADGPAFTRLPFGKDAVAIISDRARRGDTAFIQSMLERYYQT